MPQRQSGAIDANLARSTSNRTRMAVVRGEHGRHAVTHFEVIETFMGPDGKPLASRLRLALETGRTHQIRVHLAHIGHPVMGDAVYGAGFKASARRLNEMPQPLWKPLGGRRSTQQNWDSSIRSRAEHCTSQVRDRRTSKRSTLP